MSDPVYRLLVATAIILTLAWVGWSFYDGMLKNSQPGDSDYHAANRAFEDGQYAQALQDYEQALQTDSDNIHALRGKARSLMQLGRNQEALEAFTDAIEQEPDFAASYANRGILLDRMGHYRDAIRDYEKAIELDDKITEGPGWLTRFLRLQPEKPTSIADRARYLRQQLAKPESERLLRVPEVDEQQRSYKM